MKQTFLLLSFLIAASFANLVDLDAVLIGSLGDISDKALPVLSLAANLTIKPTNVSSQDVDNKNNTILQALNTTQILQKVNDEIALRLKEVQDGNLFVGLRTGFEELKGKLDNVIGLLLSENDCNDPTITDFALVARQQLRALLSRYRARKLSKYLRWYTQTNDFRLRRVAIRDLRVTILDTLKNASQLVDTTVTGGCLGLNLLGLPCLRLNVLGVLNLLPNINALINSALTLQVNLTTLTNSYNNDLALVQDIFTDVDLLDEGDNQDYQLVLDALNRKRNFVLATWEEIVSKLQALLDENNLVTLKGHVRKLLVGWKFGNNDDTLTLNKISEIVQTNNVISLEFVTTLVRDTACGCALADTVQDAAVKLQAAIKTVLQTSCLLDRINVEDALVNVADNVTKVIVHIKALELENNRLVHDILSRANIVLPDPSTYQTEFNQFVQNLTADPSAHVNEVLLHFNALKDQVQSNNNGLNITLGLLIAKKEELVNFAMLELKNFTNNVTTLTQFTESLVNRYVQYANQTFDGFKYSSDCIGVSVVEALAKIEIIKHQALVAAVQLKNATDDKVRNALNQTVENLKIQLWETFQDREVKKECHDESNEATNTGYGEVEPQHQSLVENLLSIKSNARKRLQDIKQRIKQNYLAFEDSVKIAVRAYRPSLINITVVAGADLDVNNDLSLTIEVSIEDSDVDSETEDERRKAHICILRAIFAAITTDINVAVTASIKRSTSDVYSVQSTTPMTPTTPTPTTPTPVATPTPVTTPTPAATPTPTATPTPVTTPVNTPSATPVEPVSGAISTAMSLAALIACLLFLVI